MKQIKNEELFRNLTTFLKSKGIEVQTGDYAQGIRQGCEMLTNSINVSQRTLQRAKSALGKGLNQLRETIHEQTAPKTTTSESAPQKQATAKSTRAPKKSGASKPKTSTQKRKTRKPD